MRKQDKYKNMEQANLMLEQSYLSSKNLVKEDLETDDVIGKKVIWKGKEYNIVDKQDESDFVIIDDKYNSVIGLHWDDVELVD
jgi:broad specificity polyphosphatase/5'/3'-nucleotidase SurE